MVKDKEEKIIKKTIHYEPDFLRGSLDIPIISLSRNFNIASCGLGIQFGNIEHTFEINEVELIEICKKIVEELKEEDENKK